MIETERLKLRKYTMDDFDALFNKKYCRHGFAKEAAQAVRDWVFQNTQYDTIYSHMKYANIGSYSTAIAIGMRKIKEYPDPKDTISYVYVITRLEWEALKR